jgi:septal ring factor EnvC (AmiA/AmiB activator)
MINLQNSTLNETDALVSLIGEFSIIAIVVCEYMVARSSQNPFGLFMLSWLRSLTVRRSLPNGLTDAVKQVVWVFALVFSAVVPGHAQQRDELQKQIQQLKRQYEQTTRELQERIAALEQQIKKDKEAQQNTPRIEGAVSAAELAAQEARKVAALRGSTPNSERYAHCLEIANRSMGKCY